MIGGRAAVTDELTVSVDTDRGDVRPEPFDSELLGLAIGRVAVPEGLPQPRLARLLSSIADRAADAGYDQLLRRVSATSFADIWALESTGFLLMDVGVTFARRFDGPHDSSSAAGVDVRPATEADVEQLLETMLDVPWGSRYEADPAYDRGAVRDLQARWLRNSLAGRADHVLVGHVDSRPAGYVTCRLLAEQAEQAEQAVQAVHIGEIDLVGTVPAFRGRGVAATIVDHALAWFSARVELVTVRTQATNHVAAGVYERAGMTLRHSDMTFRLALTTRGGRP